MGIVCEECVITFFVAGPIYCRTDPEKPYGTKHINDVYDLLFGDVIELYKNETSIAQYPWDIIFGNADVNQLIEITNNSKVESRAKLVAGNILNSRGVPIAQRELLGVVIEISQNNGLGSIAGYKDGSIRYINYQENIIIWETQTRQSTELLTNLFNVSNNFLKLVNTPCQKRDIFPQIGNVRISFLTNQGLYFYETKFTKIQKGEFTESILEIGVQLMLFLANQKKVRKLPGCVNMFV